MKVYFHEIKDQELVYQFDETTPWVMDVIGALDERMDRIQRPPGWKPRSRPTQVQFTLRRIDELIHVSGKAKTQLYLLCSLCADQFQYPVAIQFHTMLTQSELYGETKRETSRQGKYDSDLEDDSDDEEDLGPAMDFGATDFEVTVTQDSFADLKEILHEQIVLTLPMQPKPDTNTKGDCNKCGKPQAAMRIAQTETTPLKENPFSVLKDFSLKTEKRKPKN